MGEINKPSVVRGLTVMGVVALAISWLAPAVYLGEERAGFEMMVLSFRQGAERLRDDPSRAAALLLAASGNVTTPLAVLLAYLRRRRRDRVWLAVFALATLGSAIYVGTLTVEFKEVSLRWGYFLWLGALSTLWVAAVSRSLSESNDDEELTDGA